MRPAIDASGLAKPGPWQYALRFLFGGIVTVLAGMIARAFGPSMGGLFLAFPAILPASLTLVARHERRRDAIDDARGAMLGAAALALFALVVLLLAPRGPWIALTAATATWLAGAFLLWTLRYGLDR